MTPSRGCLKLMLQKFSTKFLSWSIINTFYRYSYSIFITFVNISIWHYLTLNIMSYSASITLNHLSFCHYLPYDVLSHSVFITFDMLSFHHYLPFDVLSFRCFSLFGVFSVYLLSHSMFCPSTFFFSVRSFWDFLFLCHHPEDSPWPSCPISGGNPPVDDSQP